MLEKSWVWNFIIKEKDSEGNVIHLKCTKCKQIFSINTGTGTLSMHLEKVDFITKEKQSPLVNSQQQTLEECVIQPLPKLKQNLINAQLVYLIASKNLSLSLVDAPHFRRFCKLLNPAYVLPNRQSLHDLIIFYANEKRLSLKEKLKCVDFFW